jgi:hypothetical protein
MASPREELEQLRALAAQQSGVTTAINPRQELEQLRKKSLQAAPVEPETQQPQIPKVSELIGGRVAAGFEPAQTLITGMAAEPVAGIAGLATLPLAGPEQAAETVRATREGLTAQPTAPEAVQALQQFSQTMAPLIEPVQKAEKGLGGAGFEAGGPVLGMIGETAPTAALTALGFGGVRAAIGIPKIVNLSKKLTTQSARTLLNEAAPTIEGLKQAARGVYKEIDDLGATVNSSRVDRLSTELRTLAKKEGFNKRIHPKVSAALDEFEASEGINKTISEIDTLRKVARGAARSIEPDEARIGSMLIERIDDALDTLSPDDFLNVKPADIGSKFKDARQLWGRAKKSELLEDAFERAQNQASGFENGLRTQFRSIINSKKKSRGFTQEEISAMQEVVRGGRAENIAKAIGKLGFSEGQATNMLMGSLGVAGGAAIGGPAGAVAVPLVGQLSRTLAQKLTRNNAIGADLIVRAGKDGKKVVAAYMKTTKPAERSISELTELLLRPEISLKSLIAKPPNIANANQKLIADAAFFADFLRTQQEQQEATE